jgi:hypothetical protein
MIYSCTRTLDALMDHKVPHRAGGSGRIYFATACVVTAAISLTVLGCASIERLPAVPYAQARDTRILDITDARFYVNETNRIDAIAQQAYQRRNKARAARVPLYFLAISGGGDDGAFGAGLLAGWSARGDRPSFDVVTGVSTGSLSAPFAFLVRPMTHS